jgi:hypothetical protein
MGVCQAKPVTARAEIDYNALVHKEKPKPKPLEKKASKELHNFRGIYKGLPFLCLDSFVSKYTGQTMYKWRNAEVRVWDGYLKTSKVLIHFEGWSDKYDKWVDLDTNDITQICPIDLMPQKQIEMGIAQTILQQKITKLFLHTGQLEEAKKQMENEPNELNNAISNQTQSPEEGNDEIMLYSKGQKIDVQDAFTKNGVIVPSKWRDGVVLDVVGSKLRVHYVGLGHDFDEVLDLKTDGHRVREAGMLSKVQSSFRKSKTEHLHSLRFQRRSFDSSPIQTMKNSIPSSINTEFDDINSPASPSILSPCESLENSLDNMDSFMFDKESPAFLLRNKEAPTRRRAPSFTSKTGKVVPGAAMGSFNSLAGDSKRRHSTSGMESGKKFSSELAFADRMEAMGLHIVEVAPDGNCLFRAVAHQLYCSEDRHEELRRKCVIHMKEHRERFEVFCTSDFDSHCQRMALDGTWAGELEIRALEEIADRVFSIYSSDDKSAKPMPMQTNFDEAMLLGMDVISCKLSYHVNHYNSVFDQKKPFPLGERKKQGGVLLKARMKLFYDS